MKIGALIDIIDYTLDQSRRLYVGAGLLAVLALGILGMDIYEIATGTVDLNRHIPFMMPVVLSMFIGICIWAQRLPEIPPAQLARVRDDSYLAPEHLPTERAEEGHVE